MGKRSAKTLGQGSMGRTLRKQEPQILGDSGVLRGITQNNLTTYLIT
jgi:hypothetical protein